MTRKEVSRPGTNGTIAGPTDELRRMRASNARLRSDSEDLKKHVARLASENSKARAIIEATSDISLELDENLRIASVLSERSDITGSFQLDIGKPLSDCGSEADLAELIETAARAVEEGRTSECELSLGDRTYIAYIVPRLSDGPATTALVSLFESEAAPRAAREARRLAEFAHNARLTTAGEMAAGLAHELNQPITSIMHFCDAAQSIASDPDPERLKKLSGILTDASDQAKRAGNIIRTLRRFLERRDLDRQPQQLNDIIRETARFMRVDCEAHGIILRLSLAGELPLVDVDATQISQVLVNLIRNSIESISIGKSRIKEIEIVTRREGNLVGSAQTTVRDTGPGISKKIAALLFEPFQTDKPNGLGMGLWICRSLVESHGGRLWADENMRKGAAFHFSLPIADGEGDTQ